MARTCRGGSSLYKFYGASWHCGCPPSKAHATVVAKLVLLDQARSVDEDEGMVRDLESVVQRAKVGHVSLIGSF